MVQQAKYDKVDAIQRRMDDAAAMIFTDYRGLNVTEMTHLRRDLQDAGATMVVTKNTLLKIALEKTERSAGEDVFVDPTAVIYSPEFPSDVAKKLLAFCKEHEAMTIKGGYVDGRGCSADEIKQIAQMPSRQELVTRLVRAMNAPIQGLAGGLHGVLSKLVYALNAVESKKTENEGS
jgi:large subunit ribosomal protein L10